MHTCRVRNSAVLDSVIGGLRVVVTEGVVVSVEFGAAPSKAADERLHPVLDQALVELSEYFGGERTDFAVTTAFTSGSEFELAVWEQIATIPYGQTRTYGEIARAVGEPGGAQAVGAACGRNPVPVIVPCHRVVGAGGKLVGFGGGLPRKRRLLALEAKVAIERGLDPTP